MIDSLFCIGLLSFLEFFLFSFSAVFCFTVPVFVKLRVRVRVKVKVKSLKSKLDPEVGSVMGWPTHHHPPPDNFF